MGENNQDYVSSHLENRIVSILRVCMIVGMVFIVVMAALTTIHALGRYIFNMPIPGLIELSCILLLLAVFLGGAYVTVTKGHISVGLIVDRLPQKVQTFIDIFNYLCCLAVTVIAIWKSIEQGLYLMKTGVEYTIISVPRFPFVLIVGLGWALISVGLVILLLHLIKAIKR